MDTTFSLFIGALLDALIGPNLFVPGEPFLIAAGYQLHQGLVSGVILVLLGGLIGDQASYFIGRKMGLPAQKKLVKWQSKTRRPIARCRYLMAKKGNAILMFARLLGPVAWVVPFMAGTHRITWRRFTLYSSIGLLLGVGQFVFWGYMLAYGLESLPWAQQVKLFVVEHKLSFYAIAVTIAFFAVAKVCDWRYRRSVTLGLFVGTTLFANYAHFFFYADDFLNDEQLQAQHSTLDMVEPSALTLKAYPGKSAVFDAQAINILYYGQNPRDLMLDIGWIENKTFSRDDLEFKDYIQLLNEKTPPVSDLFWNHIPQEMAFQLPGDLLKRSHIRWWKGGIDPKTQELYWLGAISYDNGLQITPYSGIVTVLHSIDPNVDAERDKFAQQVVASSVKQEMGYQQLVDRVILDEEHDYFTDGQVLLIKGNNG